MVPNKLKSARKGGAVVPPVLSILWQLRFVAVGHEEDRETPLREMRLGNQVEAESFNVEVKRSLWVFDPDHCLLHDKVFASLILGGIEVLRGIKI